MTYLSQVIVFVLALIGTLFKSTKTNEKGESIHTKYGLPVLTKTGKLVITLLTLSFSVSLFTVWQKAKSDEQQKNEAIIREQKLNGDLEAVKQQNQGLRDGIGLIIKASASLSKEQKENLRMLNNLSLDRDLSEVEISFRPSEEHWKEISQEYQKIKSNDSSKGYEDYYQHTTMMAEKSGDHWKISFDTMQRGISFPTFSTNQPDGKAFEKVLRLAWQYISMRWAGGSRVLLSNNGAPPFHVWISAHKIAFKFRSPEANLNLDTIRENPVVTFQGGNFSYLPDRVRVRSLDSSVTIDQTIKLDWKEGEYEYSSSISGPHSLSINFKNLSL